MNAEFATIIYGKRIEQPWVFAFTTIYCLGGWWKRAECALQAKRPRSHYLSGLGTYKEREVSIFNFLTAEAKLFFFLKVVITGK